MKFLYVLNGKCHIFANPIKTESLHLNRISVAFSYILVVNEVIKISTSLFTHWTVYSLKESLAHCCIFCICAVYFTLPHHNQAVTVSFCFLFSLTSLKSSLLYPQCSSLSDHDNQVTSVSSCAADWYICCPSLRSHQPEESDSKHTAETTILLMSDVWSSSLALNQVSWQN